MQNWSRRRRRRRGKVVRGGPIDTAIGANIRRYRVKRNMTQADLGDKIGVTHTQIYKYEEGKNAVPSTRLSTLAVALRVSTDALLNHGGRK